MGLIVSTLRSCCLGTEKAPLERLKAQHSPLGKDREKNENCVEDTESKKINLDYSCLQYEELSTPIRYYILTNLSLIHI